MVTLRMIAERCGVSIASVSKALNGASDLSQATSMRIRRVAEEMGYMPNAAAKALRTNRSYTFGIIFEEAVQHGLTHEFFSRILNSFLQRSEALGYDVLFLGAQPGGRSLGYADHARYRNCDGVFLIAGSDVFENIVGDVRMADCPIVCIDYEFDGVSSVVSDNEHGMRKLVEYAIQLGHRRIAFIHGENTNVTRARLRSFFTVCAEKGIKVPPEYVVPSVYHNAECAQVAVRALLDLPEPPTCVLFPDDFSYIGGMNEFRNRGLNVPADISAAGYDGMLLSQSIWPRLTTLRQDAEGMGVRAAEILARQAENGPPYPVERAVLQGVIVPGETIRPQLANVAPPPR